MHDASVIHAVAYLFVCRRRSNDHDVQGRLVVERAQNIPLFIATDVILFRYHREVHARDRHRR